MLKKVSRILASVVLVIGVGSVLTASISWHQVHAEEDNSSSSNDTSVDQSKDNNGSGSGNGTSSSVNPLGDACKYNKDAAICKGEQKPLAQTITDIVKFVVGFIGVIAVIVIIWAGWTYVTSAGASDKVMLAKRTILYAIIGLVVTIMAGAIVAFVVNTFK